MCIRDRDGAGGVNGSIWLPGVDIEDDDYILGRDWISEPAHWESRGICPNCGSNYDYIWLYFVECDDDPFTNETTAPHLSPGEEQALIMYRHIDDSVFWRLLHPGPLQDWRWPRECRQHPNMPFPDPLTPRIGEHSPESEPLRRLREIQSRISGHRISREPRLLAL